MNIENIQYLQQCLEATQERLNIISENEEDIIAKKEASILLSFTLNSFKSCPPEAGCDGCKCGYDNGGNPTKEDTDTIIGGGGGTIPE